MTYHNFDLSLLRLKYVSIMTFNVKIMTFQSPNFDFFYLIISTFSNNVDCVLGYFMQ